MGLRTFFGAPCHPAANDISIRRDGETLTVDFTSFGKRKSLQGTAVLLHEGVVPETRITRLARCRHAWNPRQRYWHAETDVWGKTNVCGIGSRATREACAEAPPSPAASRGPRHLPRARRADAGNP
ncbi:MAG: hypothetical protein ACLTTU_13565 [Bilophila wadsworthia]